MAEIARLSGEVELRGRAVNSSFRFQWILGNQDRAAEQVEGVLESTDE